MGQLWQLTLHLAWALQGRLSGVVMCAVLRLEGLSKKWDLQ